MNKVDSNSEQQKSSSTQMLIAMVGIGILCALLIVMTFEKTRPVIQRKKAEALEKAIFKVIPNSTSIKVFSLDESGELTLETGEKKEGSHLFAGYNDKDEFIGLAIEASGQGYADVIRILYGCQPDKEEVIGFYVLESKETPGLGDKIEKDENFLANFRALDVSLSDDKNVMKNQVVTVKQNTKKNPWEIDGITGATISSRAIGDILANSTNYWMPVIYRNKHIFIANEGQNTAITP